MIPRTYGLGTYGDCTYGQPWCGETFVPTIAVEIWSDDIGTDWLDITCDVRTIEIDRGRQTLLEAFAAGSATLEIANFDDKYSPWNDSSVWGLSGRFQTDVPIRVRLDYADGPVMLFTGTTDSVNDSWPNVVDAMVTVTATDGFKYLARAEGKPLPAPVGAGEHSGARIQRWLGLTDWWQGTVIDTGVTTLEGTALDGVALEGMQEVEWNEGGFLLCDTDGQLVFQDRDALDTDPRMSAVQARFVDTHPDAAHPTPPWACYSDIVPAADESLIYNVATFSRAGALPQTATDQESIDWFGPRPHPSKTLIVDNDPDVLSRAQLVILQHAANERRIDSLTVHPSRSEDSDAWWVAGHVQILDRVYVERHFPGGHVLTEQLLVQGVKHSITAQGTTTPTDWTATFATSLALPIGGRWDTEPGDPVAHGWDQDSWAV